MIYQLFPCHLVISCIPLLRISRKSAFLNLKLRIFRFLSSFTHISDTFSFYTMKQIVDKQLSSPLIKLRHNRCRTLLSFLLDNYKNNENPSAFRLTGFPLSSYFLCSSNHSSRSSYTCFLSVSFKISCLSPVYKRSVTSWIPAF